MNMTNAVFQETSVYPKKYDREASLPTVGQHSRAIIPGDDPGDQRLCSSSRWRKRLTVVSSGTGSVIRGSR